MTLPKNPEEGDNINCPDCGESIVARLKTYKDDQYPAYVQWQNKKETVSHKTKDGNCKDSITTEGTQTESTQQKVTTSSNIEESNVEPEKLDDEGKKIFDNLLLLHKIDKMTIDYLGKDAQVQKIGLWTKLIFQAMCKK